MFPDSPTLVLVEVDGFPFYTRDFSMSTQHMATGDSKQLLSFTVEGELDCEQLMTVTDRNKMCDVRVHWSSKELVFKGAILESLTSEFNSSVPGGRGVSAHAEFSAMNAVRKEKV